MPGPFHPFTDESGEHFGSEVRMAKGEKAGPLCC